MTAIAGLGGAPTTVSADKLDRGDPADAARKLEAFFIRQFLAQARPQNPGMLDGGFAGDTFRGMLDDAMATAISDGGGLGMAGIFEGALGGEARTPARTSAPTGPAGPTGPIGPSIPTMPNMIDQLDHERAMNASGPAAVSGAGGVMQRPAPGRFSSGFGRRVDPMGAGSDFHPGLDIAAVKGTPVVAAAAGQVIHAGPAGTYGNMIAVRHADGTETRYAHLSAVDVKVGDQVAAGAHLGAVGSTGRSTGPHLHFEVLRKGKAVDPRPYLEGPATGQPGEGP